jgi:thioesterase domain-containing protein
LKAVLAMTKRAAEAKNRDVYEARHIEYAARLLSSRKYSTDWSPLVPMRSHGDRLPLFLVPGIDGEVVVFGALTRHLPPAQPVYGLRDARPDIPPGAPFMIESIAATYADAMRRVHPAGPYLVAAYSAGCILAYELAQQLLAGGDQVALLAMIDAEVPPEIPQRLTPASVYRFAKSLPCRIGDELRFSTVPELTIRARTKVRRLLAWTRPDTPFVEGGRDHADIRNRLGVQRLSERFVPWLEAFIDALARYHPKPYAGRIVLLRADGTLRKAHDQGWGAFARDGVDVRVIPGNHVTVLREPSVRLLAAALMNTIDNATSPAVLGAVAAP